MNRLFLLLFLCMEISTAPAQNKKESFPEYKGNDLGLSYSAQRSVFRIWAPTAEKVQLTLYSEPLLGTALQSMAMTRSAQGTWTATVKGDQKGKYYTFSIQYKGQWLDEVPDPYAKAVGTNGLRAMIVDLGKTNPAGWQSDKSPALKSKTDAIIYELHVRDASIDASSGITHKGKFIGLTETGTKNKDGLKTGLDHLLELGVTHIHLLPFFDYNSVNEKDTVRQQYNWGYDPLNFNSLEGSYSTNAADGNVRIKEFKQLVKAFHDKGLSVVMDVVYNHTGLTERSNFNQLVPGYYYRHTADGKFSNATACGNETASEKAMMRKFMLESVLYWVKEYHVDGFRFDLMGVHDNETMNIISKALHKIKPGILLYGEGWTAGSCPLPDSVRALKHNVSKLNGLAVFSDDIRDGIKGSVFEAADKGFASGKPGMEESIKFGVVAACRHPQVDYKKVNYSKAPYAKSPADVISYAECHDNNVLWDKLVISTPNATNAERANMHKLALSIVLTSQGISFLHAGTEFLRTKKGIENSYNSPDSINEIDWNLKTTNKDVFDYVRQLIRMRKSHPAFRMQTTEQLQQNIRFDDAAPAGVVSYEINGAAVGDSWKKIQVWFNGSNVERTVNLQDASWKKAIDNNLFVMPAAAGILVLKPYSCSLLFKDSN